jgi:glycosyltransferase involved in cell wall biosynthesis
MVKEKIIILFDGPHLAYSPTTIQLYDELKKRYDVTIIAQDPSNYNGQRLYNRKVLYHKYYKVNARHLYLLLFKVLRYFNSDVRYFEKNKLNYRDYFFKFLFIKKVLQSQKYKRIICIDIQNLFFCSLLNRKVDFLSLELCQNGPLLKLVRPDTISAVIIQSKERYEYLFKEASFKIFYVQNAPIFKPIPEKLNRKFLIYAGGAHSELGFYHCLNFLKKYPKETLIVQGALLDPDKKRIELNYSSLITEKRLIMNTVYLENDDVVNYLSQFEMGFCLYNFDDAYLKANYFNYATAPSGKVFKYLAAGIPVICNNIIGFQFVKDMQCGELVDNLNEDEIYQAIIKVRANYKVYTKNAAKAAATFSFDKAILPYMQYIE